MINIKTIANRLYIFVHGRYKTLQSSNKKVSQKTSNIIKEKIKSSISHEVVKLFL